MKRSGITQGYVRMWPRAVFEKLRGEKGMRAGSIEFLRKDGVYVLYREDKPHYVGKGRLMGRLWAHARKPEDRYYHFWNFFSAFAVEDKEQRDELEAILIAAMPTANSAEPKLPKEIMPGKVRELLHEIYAHGKA